MRDLAVSYLARPCSDSLLRLKLSYSDDDRIPSKACLWCFIVFKGIVWLLATCRMGFLELHDVALALELLHYKAVVVVAGHRVHQMRLLKRFDCLGKLINRLFLHLFLLFCGRLRLILRFGDGLLSVLVA